MTTAALGGMLLGLALKRRVRALLRRILGILEPRVRRKASPGHDTMAADAAAVPTRR